MILRVAAIILFGMSGSLIAADEPVTPAEKMAAMRQRAEALQLRIGDQKDLRRVGKQPLLRYNDPARTTTDGTLWLWTQDERPVAAVCLFNDSREGFQWNYELVSLCDSALLVDGRQGWNWKPAANMRTRVRITEPAPADSEPARLIQMKELLTQFQAEEELDGQRTQLRLLPRPVHRYRCADEKIDDGAMFLFVFGTNPEVLTQIEVLSDRSWQISFARCSSAILKVIRDEKTVWEADRVREWNPSHEYFSHYGPDRGENEPRKSP